jgi:hypothetical protein
LGHLPLLHENKCKSAKGAKKRQGRKGKEEIVFLFLPLRFFAPLCALIRIKNIRKSAKGAKERKGKRAIKF